MAMISWYKCRNWNPSLTRDVKGSAGSVLTKRNSKNLGGFGPGGAHQGLSWTKLKKRGSSDDETGKRDQGRSEELRISMRKIEIDRGTERFF
jgi:hypothetical protein